MNATEVIISLISIKTRNAVLPFSSLLGVADGPQYMQPTDTEHVREVLRGVCDPELGLSIVDLGLVYHVSATPDGVDVAFTLTTPSCPMGEFLTDEIRDRVTRAFPDAPAVSVRLVWDPPWSPDQMSDSLRRQFS